MQWTCALFRLSQCVLFLGLSALALAQAPTADLRFGWYEWDPYQYRNEQGALTGLDVQLMRTAAARADLTVEFEPRAWDRQLLALQRGEQDVTVGFKTDTRASYAHFSEPLRYETNVLYVRRGSSFNFEDQAGLMRAVRNGTFRLGVVAGYAYGPDSMRNFLTEPAVADKLINAADDQANFRRLFADDIDGFLTDRTVAATVAWRNDWQDQVREHPAYQNREPIYLIYSKASVDPQTVAAVDRALASMHADGSYRSVVRAYLFPVLLSITVTQPWFFAIDILGTIAFALSGLALAKKERYTLVGAFVLAALPAVGGGVMRDLLLDRHPIGVLRSPIYLVAILATVLTGYVALRIYKGWLVRHQRTVQFRERVGRFAGPVVALCDALGLAAFTVTGVVVAVETQAQPLWLWGPILAGLTGAGGGILRDVVRADVDNPNLKSVFYVEVALIWGFILSLFLIWQSERMSYREVFIAVVAVVVGGFLTRMFVAHKKLRAPMF